MVIDIRTTFCQHRSRGCTRACALLVTESQMEEQENCQFPDVQPEDRPVLYTAFGRSCMLAVELESGESAEAFDEGALGEGKWRLRVEADPEVTAMSLLRSTPTGQLTNLSGADASRGFERVPAALLQPPVRVTLSSSGERELHCRWSAVIGVRYAVDLLQDGVRDDGRSLTRSSQTSFHWTSLSPGT